MCNSLTDAITLDVKPLNIFSSLQNFDQVKKKAYKRLILSGAEVSASEKIRRIFFLKDRMQRRSRSQGERIALQERDASNRIMLRNRSLPHMGRRWPAKRAERSGLP